MPAPPPRLRHPSLRTERRAGMTMIEVVLALTILVVAMLATSSTFLAAHRLDAATAERRTALEALEGAVTSVTALSERLALENDLWSTAVAEALSAGGTPGTTVAVDDLSPWPGEPAVIEITLVTDETRTDADFGVQLGLPRDLDGDGEATNIDVRDTARILPVVVRARWDGSSGQRELARAFFLKAY